jgi:hypothetical protein
MDQAIVEIHQMQECRRPILGRERSTVQQGAGANGKFVVVDFGRTILGWTISTSGFDSVVEFPQKEVLLFGAASKFATLFCTDTPALLMTVLSEKFFDNVERGRFRVSEEDPDVAQSFVNN